MYVKQPFLPGKYIRADAPFADAHTNRLKRCVADVFESGYGDFQEVIADQWRLPDCPKHQNDVVPFQVLKYTLDQNFSGPRFPLRRTELRHRNSIGMSPGPRFGFER